MIKTKILYLLLILLLLTSSCINHYKYTNKRQAIIRNGYNINDTILVADYILCNGLRNINKNMFSPKGGEVVPIDHDSVFVCFQSAMGKLNIPLRFLSVRNNHCDSIFHENVLLKYRKVDHNRIKEISKSVNSKFVIVPFIYIDNTYENKIAPHSSGLTFGSAIVKNSYLNIAIYILQDNEIIYFKSGMHSTISHHEDFEEETVSQKQIHWDRLVHMLMGEFLK